MAKSAESYDSRMNDLLNNLEKRISRIEKELQLSPIRNENKSAAVTPEQPVAVSEPEDLELHIGQYWFAKAGIIVLALGIVFLLTFPYQNLPGYLPSLFGYVLVGVIFTLSHFWRDSIAHISRYFMGGGLLLLYFTTLRLHLFGNNPVIADKPVEIVLLSIVVLITLFISFRKRSMFLTSLSLTLGYITTIVANQPWIFFIGITILAVIAVYLKITLDWQNLYIYGIILTYFTHFLWFINNPFMGQRIEMVSEPHTNIFFIIIYTIILAMGILFRKDIEHEDVKTIVSGFVTGFGSYAIFLLLTITKFRSDLILSNLLFSVVLIALSIIFWIRVKSRYTTFFYAISGYTAMSVAIIAQFGGTDYFIWLSWQSMLVISTAVWFRSKIIIVANFLIFLTIFFSYLALVDSVDWISLSFGIVALVSARVLNWKKHRLELKTEMMRNAYLVTAFFIFPYTLYHLLPAGYTGLSWVVIAGIYYILSRMLTNNKYRWMAIGTLLLSVVYVFIIGMTFLDPVYRIVLFLVLGTVLLVTSIVYTKSRSKKLTISQKGN